MKSEMISPLIKRSGKAAIAVLIGLAIAGCAPKEEVLGLHQTGTMAFMLNCDQAASTYFEKAIKTNPEYGPSYIMLGDCYIREGKPEKAIKVIKKGLQYTSDEGHQRLAHRKLARAYHEIGQDEKALPHIMKYTRMSIMQDKFDETKKADTVNFIASLNIPEEQKVDLDPVIAACTAKRKKMLAEAEALNKQNRHQHSKESKDITGAVAGFLGLD
ncbi:tetratricopeptide repeat protein [Maridesulfovibrio bastinii]|uniref:tetratricopeptide repeat protein n=1 Tax=Maridesulfovibrio bastinii TaxID=47157 RepID=UPI0004127B23|nr:tetratricopeptide repeat protein [Maridesulfovibrio bastinii]